MIWIVLLYLPAFLAWWLLKIVAFLVLPPRVWNWIWLRCRFACRWGDHCFDWGKESPSPWYVVGACKRCGVERREHVGMP